MWVPINEDMKKANNALKDRKSVGSEDSLAEAVKAIINTTTEWMHTLYNKVWQTEALPVDFKESCLVKLPTKEDHQGLPID